MIKKVFSLILASVFALALALPAIALTDVSPKHETPAGYNEHDYQKLVAFLETEVTKYLMDQPITYTNGFWLFDNLYDPEDPETWGDKFSWVDADGELRIESIDVSLPDYYAEVGGELDLSGCTALNGIYCRDNMLTGIDVSGCTALERIHCISNMISRLDLSGCCALETLDCAFNELTELDLSGCPALFGLQCPANELTELDLTGCSLLTHLGCANNSLTELDLSCCPALETLQCSDNSISELDLQNCAALETLDCGDNQITELDLTGCAALLTLSCSYNPLTSLDVSPCSELNSLYCIGCELTELDLSGLENLFSVFCESNPLTSIDLTGCTRLEQIKACDAMLTSFDASDSTRIGMPPVLAEGAGCFGVEAEPFDECKEDGWWYDLYAYADDGEEFLGWYDENGDLLCENERFSAEFYIGEEDPWSEYECITARFSGGSAVVPGDMNGDGAVAVADAILALRAAMGIVDITPEQLEAGDLNGDGSLSVADAIAILRIAMGLM